MNCPRCNGPLFTRDHWCPACGSSQTDVGYMPAVDDQPYGPDDELPAGKSRRRAAGSGGRRIPCPSCDRLIVSHEWESHGWLHTTAVRA